MRLVTSALLIVAILVAPAAGADPAAEPPRAGTMPLSEVRPGMEGVVRTVFEGDRVEEFTAEIVAVMQNFLGPRQDLILARLKGARVEFTGVAAGMSGSPVYIDGRLVGALSYRIGSFMKEPIAGITPIEYMLDVSPGGPDSGADPSRVPAAAAGASGVFGSVEPIETPLMVAGVPAEAMRMYAADFERLGLGSAAIGAGGAAGTAGGTAAGDVAAAGLQPGEPVAAELISGDISFAATGTVTHVDGDRVFAFGHPAFMSGAADIPMARASIYLTLPSLQASNKLGRVGDTIGTFRQSRLPAMTGVIGPKPSMIPVSLEVRAENGSRRTFQYELVDHAAFTPTLIGFVTAASLINTPGFADEMTMTLSGRFGFADHPELVLNDVYTGFTANQSAATALARDVEGLFAAVYQNRFERPRVRSVDLTITSVEKGSIGFVEAVYPTRTEVDPGEAIEFRALIRPYRGESYTRTFVWKVPEGTPSGPLVAYIGGSNLLGAVERNILSRQVRQADDLNQIISLVNRLRTSDKLYMKIIRRHEGAVVQNEILPALPPSIFSTLNANRGTGEVTPVAETTVLEESIPLGQMIVGGTAVPLKVR